MTNKSEELAKILKIEPKEQILCGICEYDEDLDESDICPHYIADECKNIEWIYPDFTHPRNFVKLLGIQAYTRVTLFQEITHIMHGVEFQEVQKGFINRLIELFKYNNYSEKFFESIRQQAQQTDWVY